MLQTWPSWLLLAASWATRGSCMTDDTIAELRQDTRDLFYHGYTNYMDHAFPEDELKPISCKPQTRNADNPADIGLNDVLGNYSLTLIDSLSTLAILASGENDKETDGRSHWFRSSSRKQDSHDSLLNFQSGVQALVELYGSGDGECGSRACGFDLDSKVQVFETNIRGVGGLLSAHLFAIGELPIRGYKPDYVELRNRPDPEAPPEIRWPNNFMYNGQLLRLAYDLAQRLLPAFSTQSGLPYPRVNLRRGIPFYQDAEDGVCRVDGTSKDSREITETCSAGAGSLVLEFTTLSRLTGDDRFEKFAKKAFWAVWQRRSPIGLIGGGIDAESGQWTMPPLAGIGAGVDSFFEYALKSHILLSNLPYDPSTHATDAPENFLAAWEDAHASVKRHVMRSNMTEKHPFYGQADLLTGAPRYSWIDNLSAYYPGLLTLAGELDEAIETHLLYTALWTRYSALPERWHAFNGAIEPAFKHWAGRPEFIESTWYLYRATKDPFYLHTGEMALRDIRRRCWTKCGWADLGDVINGQQRDRMESFFLGETAKYLFLLFDEDHPLNHIDAPVVFTTEGHPLLIPRYLRRPHDQKTAHALRMKERDISPEFAQATCPAPPPALPLTISATAARSDVFHAAALAQLHLVPINPSRSSPLLESSVSSPGISIADVRSPTNYTFYPWTLPLSLVPVNGFSYRIATPIISTLTFPNLNAQTADGLINMGAMQKVVDGILVNSLSNLKLNMVQEPKAVVLSDGMGVEVGQNYRIHGIANWALGKDEKVLLSQEALAGVSPTDPHFTRVKDLEMCDLIIDVPVVAATSLSSAETEISAALDNSSILDGMLDELESMFSGLWGDSDVSLELADTETVQPTVVRQIIPAILPTGIGAAPLPKSIDQYPDPTTALQGQLPFRSILFLDDVLCDHRLPAGLAKKHQILVVFRGGCSFSDKLANIPSFAPAPEGLQLVIILSVAEAKSAGESKSSELIRPLLDVPQMTPSGFERRNQISMVMVDGSQDVVEALRLASSAVGAFDRHGKLVESAQSGATADGRGLGVRRRYWFESMGVPIANLLML